MPSLRPDNALNEFIFTQEESRAARFLDANKIAWIQTKYAIIFKQKAASLIPETEELDRAYICRVAEYEGQLNILQEFLDDHKAAIAEMSEVKKEGVTETIDIDSVGTRASKLVDG